MSQHKHYFQKEGNTWACFGLSHSCGLRAPACFEPVEEATVKYYKQTLFEVVFQL